MNNSFQGDTALTEVSLKMYTLNKKLIDDIDDYLQISTTGVAQAAPRRPPSGSYEPLKPLCKRLWSQEPPHIVTAVVTFFLTTAHCKVEFPK
jgi:hypothetical protein